MHRIKNATRNNPTKSLGTRYVYTWTTHDEIHFLNNIGVASGKNRQALLRGYRDGVSKRTAWGAINPHVIKKYLDIHILPTF